jgi:hypothetical protein
MKSSNLNDRSQGLSRGFERKPIPKKKMKGFKMEIPV